MKLILTGSASRAVELMAVILAVALGLLPGSPAAGATLSPELLRLLPALSPTDTVSVILRLRERADLSDFPGRRADARAVMRRLRAHATHTQGPVLALLRARGGEGRGFWISNAIAARIPVRMLPEVETLSAVETIEPDARSPEEVVSSGGSPEWGLVTTGVDRVWKTYGLDGTGIVVGSMDTGFDPNHPALQGKWRGGTNSWIDLVAGQPVPYDDHSHGTHTIGTIVGGDGPGPFSPDIGIAYGARFIAAKTKDANLAETMSRAAAGAEWMMDPDGDPETNDFPHVINNSWGFVFSTTYSGFHPVAEAWRAAGIIAVFAAGNSGPNAGTVIPPGSHDNTIGVAATDMGDLVAGFSSRGPSPVGDAFPADRRKPDLSAPGVGVHSAVPGGGYSAFSGTSMAAPHVSGVVALMLQAHSGPMSPGEVRSALLETAVDLGPPGFDFDYGYGRLDAFEAVELAMLPSLPLTVAAEGHAVELSWNASIDPGVFRYDVYRSSFADDPAPLMIGSTADTAFTDPHRVGPWNYRVLPVRAGDPLPSSNEVAVDVCLPAAAALSLVNAAVTNPTPADFDGDGDIDVATTVSLMSGSVVVAPGTAAGSFGSVATFPAGTRPEGLAAADFDADGILDLAVANNANAGTVSILIGGGTGGVGDGTFGAPVPYPAGSSPSAIACADFDQDGIMDLAATSRGGTGGTGEVVVLRGQGKGGGGDGTFAAAIRYAVGGLLRGIVTGDFDEDGALDLAVTNSSSGTVSVLLGRRTDGRADGTFHPATHFACGTGAHRLATGDFDSDGITDLAATRNLSPGFVSILRGQGAGGVGDGTFAAPADHAAGLSPQAIAAGDLSGDGITDLCVTNGSNAGTVSILLGTGSVSSGDGGFEPPVALAAGTNPTGVVFADLGGDGMADLVGTQSTGNQNLFAIRSACGSEAGTALTVITPNGGEEWPAGATRTIQWSKDPGVVSVTIEVSRDDGATWRTVATDRTGTSFDWVVTAPLAAGSARVRISDARVSAADGSDQPFTIGPEVPLAVQTDPPLRPALSVENPSLDRLNVRVRFVDWSSATLEVLDVGGRRVLLRRIGDLGPGDHALGLGHTLRAGIYVVRLTQGATRIAKKAVVVR